MVDQPLADNNLVPLITTSVDIAVEIIAGEKEVTMGVMLTL